MTTPGNATATLEDLDADLDRYDSSEDGNLKKLLAFSRVALYLHDSAATPEERRSINEDLHRLVRKHGLPDHCLDELAPGKTHPIS
jgi:hypothetical protein